MKVNRKRTSLFSEKVSMWKFVKGLPEGTHPIEAATQAQEQFLPPDRRQEIKTLSVAVRVLQVWREAAEKGQAIIVSMPQTVAKPDTRPAETNTDDEVLDADHFTKLRSMLKPGLYLVRIV